MFVKALRCVLCVAVAIVAGLRPAAAQTGPAGSFTLTLDRLPNVAAPATELRARLFGEQTLRPSDPVTIHLEGFVEGLVDRNRGERSRDAIVRVQDAYLEIAGERADFRAGYSRVVWGRLDEIQPTDVINPLDLARFFFEGRAEARLPVTMARGRLFFGERATVDALVVPDFRRATFDQLDEDSSPFNLEADRVVCLGIGVCPPIATEVREPGTSFGNLQGGARLSATTGRVDWAIGAWRGFDAFGAYELLPPDPLALTQELRAIRTFPRYTMIGGDFETVRGSWAWRGEVAAFTGETDRFDAGVGFDRRAGDYHVSGTLLVQRDAEVAAPGGEVVPASTSTSIVSAAERTFARERYRTRAFLVYNLTEGSAFARNITSMEVRENVSLEGSVGWFFGSGDAPVSRDVITRFSDRDFLYARVRIHF
jgi:hypothetical protein